MNIFSHVLDSIKEASIFRGLTDEQNAELLRCGQHIKLHTESVLFHQGDPATSCFLVNHGRLKLTKFSEQGKEVIFRYIGVGELTAAVAVFKNTDYPVTAYVIDNTEVTAWDKQTMIALMHRYPDIAINLLRIILERIDDVQNRYIEICTEHVDQRIARSLLRIMRRAGKETPEGIHIDIPLSRQNIADYSGTTLYTVSRTLSVWEKIGWIKSERKQIIVINPHALVKFTETG